LAKYQVYPAINSDTPIIKAFNLDCQVASSIILRHIANMPISMVNVIELSQVVELLDEIASPSIVDRALRSAGLSRRTLLEHVGFLPYRLEMILIENVARALGDQNLGATLAIKFSYGAYNSYAGFVLGAEDLYSAILRGRKAFPFIQPGSEIVLSMQGPYTLIGRRCIHSFGKCCRPSPS
jgi:hypothetical protein